MPNKRILQSMVFVAFLSATSLLVAHEPDATQSLELDEAAIGTVTFENSCSDDVQATFNRGIALLHSFWFAAAIDSFS